MAFVEIFFYVFGHKVFLHMQMLFGKDGDLDNQCQSEFYVCSRFPTYKKIQKL